MLVRKTMLVLSTALVTAALAGSPAMAACKDDLAKVKAAVAAAPESKRGQRDSAAVKIKEAEDALAKKNEAACAAAVKAADATLQ